MQNQDELWKIIKCCGNYYLRKGRQKIDKNYYKKKNRYCGRNLFGDEQAQILIQNKISKGIPFMAARFGSVELRCMREKIYMEYGLLKQYSTKSMLSMQNNAGFFPCNEDNFYQFYELMSQSCKQVDILGVWYNEMEDFFIQYFMESPSLIRLRALEPYYTKIHWTSALKGKKVLVIHPFADSIAHQYEKRELIFKEQDILPEFKLMTMKAVVTHADQKDERFNSWFDALDYMLEEAMTYDFDCALIGCGAYGFPLAAALKMQGKQAIHMGGATQLLFGIKGKRWDDNPQINRLYNSAWIRPSDEEIPRNPASVENGCYW